MTFSIFFIQSRFGIFMLFLALGFSAVQSAPAQTTPEAVIKAFYNGYIRSTGKGEDPFGKRSRLKKHLTARLIKEQVAAHEASQDEDYFLKSPVYHGEWENNFIVANLLIRRATANAVVTFPDGGARVKVSLRQEAGNWKINGVEKVHGPQK